MEVAAEPALVGEAGHPHHHPVAGTARRRRTQGRRLAAQLVLGVVQVGEVLDLGDRHEAGEGRTQGDAEDRLLVEQRVEHPSATEPLVQTASDAVNTALDGHVLTEEQCLRMGRHQLGQRGVDGLRQRQRCGRSPGRAGAGGASDLGERDRRHDRLTAAERLLVHHAGRVVHHLVTDRLVAVQHLVRRPGAALDEHAGACEEGVPRVVGHDLGGGAVGDLRVRAGVAEEADRVQVQDAGPSGLAYVGQRVGDNSEQRLGIGAVHLSVTQPRDAAEHRTRPAAGRPGADPDGVVLADEQHGTGQPAVAQVGSGVECTEGGGVVRRGVAEAAHHDGVVGPGRPYAGPARQVQRVGQPDRPRQVGTDRRGLRDDVQRRVAEDLVPTAGHGIAAGRGETEQDVADRVGGLSDGGPGGVEATGPVVEQGRVLQARQQAQGRVALVTGRADRVVAPALAVQPARREVEVPALRLCLEEPSQERVVHGRFAGGRARSRART